MSDEHSNDVALHGYPPIPSEIPTTKDGWRQRAIGLKLRLSAAESQSQALQERIEELEKGLRNITSGIDHHPTRSNDAHDADHLYSFVQSALGIVDQRAQQLLSPNPGD